MTCDLPFMKLWVKDLMGDPDVRDMSLEEFGAYLRLLCDAWQKGSIPNDPKLLARKLKVTPRRFEAIWEIVGPKWESDGNGGLVNRRQEEEREDAFSKSKSARKAAEARWAGAK